MFQEQLALLGRRNARLAERVAQASADCVTVSPSRAGPATALVDLAGRPLALHSKYDPLREADQFVEAGLEAADRAHALIGLGLGYHAQALRLRLARSVLLLLFENDPAVLRAALEHCDLSALLRDPNVHWLGSEPNPVMLEHLLPLAGSLAEGLTVLVTPATTRRSADYIERVRGLLGEVSSYGAMAQTTQVKQGRRTIGNLIGNLTRYARAEPLGTWQNRWRGRAAMVVAAGPSLTRNRHLLPQAKGRLPIIAVGTALKQLVGLGVWPDVVVHIDHSDLCGRHFQGIDPDEHTVLLADPTAAPVVLDVWPGRLAFTRHPFAEHLLGPLAPSTPALDQGITVAHTAFYAAQFFGADPVILVGQDLAFPDGVYYSPGNGLHEIWQPELNRFLSIETKEWERLVRRKSQLRTVADWSGGEVFTDKQMSHYLRQFERDFARSSSTVIDATEGGARKQGAHPMPLAEALDRYAGEPFPPEWTAAPSGVEPPTTEQVEQRLRAARERLGRFENLAAQIVELQRKVLAYYDNDAQVARLMDRVGKLQRSIQQSHLTEFQLSAELDGAAEVDKDRRTREIEAANLDQREAYRQCIERDRNYVAALHSAAGELEALLEQQLQPIPA